MIAISLEEGDLLRWVRLTRAEDSIVIGSRRGMSIHFRANHKQLRPLGRATRGVRSMRLREGDEFIGMDILPANVVETLGENAEDEDDPDDLELLVEEDEANEEDNTTIEQPGPWVLVITTHGFGKRTPVAQFRLQNRAGKGVTATKFKKLKTPDQLAALRIVNADDELMLVTSRGIVIRQAVMDISSQSRAATGVRVQRFG